MQSHAYTDRNEPFFADHWLTTDVRQDAMVMGGTTIQMVLSGTTAVVTVRGSAMIVLCQRLLAL